jgi:DNA-binding transcriptional regulator LsrR (DeoR family)
MMMDTKHNRDLPPRQEWPEIRLMVRLATLHYREGLAQREIAELTGLSPAKVSRLLKKAHEKRIVEVEIRNPLPFHMAEEIFLEKSFNLHEAIVVPRTSNNEDVIIRSIGSVAADHLLELTRDNMIVVIGQGTTMRAVVDQAKSVSIPPRQVTVAPMVGGLTKASPETHTNFLARELANTMGGTHLELYAPQLADSVQNRDAFMSESSVTYVLAKARAADIIISGIGDVSETSRLIELCSFSRRDMERLDEGGAVGEFGSIFYNADGQTCCQEFNNRVIGLTLEEIRRVPLVIGVAGGDRKIEAIRGLLKGGGLDVLVTDDVVARTIREREEKVQSVSGLSNGAEQEDSYEYDQSVELNPDTQEDIIARTEHTL